MSEEVAEIKKHMKSLVYGMELLLIVMTLLTFLGMFRERTVIVLYVFIWLTAIGLLVIGYKIRKKCKEDDKTCGPKQ